MDIKNLGHQLIATCLFVGYTPLMPGSTTSLIAATTLFLMPELSIIQGIIILNILFILGTVSSERIIEITKIKDPSFIVIDEWFGMWLSLFLAPKQIWIYGLAFILFRFFDILKPLYISKAENKIPGGLGTMMDDTISGFFTFVIIQIICMFL